MRDSLPIHAVADWQTQLRDTIGSAQQLLDMLNLTADQVGFSEQASKDFPLKLPVAFARRMRVGDPADPLLRQVLASNEETQTVPGYLRDPVGETGSANPEPGIIHKYRGRALLLVTSACAINCRYCFRRHFPYEENQNSRLQWRETLAYIGNDQSIQEVILSGGDPLVANDRLLRELCTRIAAFPHVRRLRIHSRLPIVLPDRVTPGLLDAIVQPRLQTVVVVHSNHANEIDTGVHDAVCAMRERGVTVLNQAVLLKGVNDSVDALVNLSESLFAAGILPYYLHLLDKVEGAAHFDLSEVRAKQLMVEVAARLPGYLVPRLVREEAGASAKTGIVFND
jgi:EF-P beta-lysylation protein EpmB